MTTDAPQEGRRPDRRIAVFVTAGVLALAAAGAIVGWRVAHRPAGGAAALSPEQYRQMVSAFYSGVTAMDVDSNEVAVNKLTAATQIDPMEPAAWADLGLMYLRTGNVEMAGQDLERAHALAPSNSSVEMLLGLLESRKGNFADAVGHYQRAIQLDPKNLRARYAMIGSAEREAGPNSDAQVAAQLKEILSVQPDNLVALLDSIRQAAKAGDSAAARELTDRLSRLSSRWPAGAQEQLKQLRQAVDGPNVSAAATRVAFLRNVLVREPEFRRNLTAVMTPLERVGEPIERFITLHSPSPTAAPADDGIKFETSAIAPDLPKGATGVAPVWLSKDAPADVAVVSDGAVRIAKPGGFSAPFPGDAGPDSVVAVDWANDFHPGLVLAGSKGVRLLKQDEKGGFADVTTAAIPDQSIRNGSYAAVWAVDLDLDGDIDIVLAPRDGEPIVLRNNSDGSFTPIKPFPGVSGARSLVWADLDGDGAPDAAIVDAGGKLSVFVNDRGGKFHSQPTDRPENKVLAIASADLTRDGVLNLLALEDGGQIVRLTPAGEKWGFKQVAVSGRTDGNARLIAADVDKNGAIDLVVSTPGGSQILLAGPGGEFTAKPLKADARVFAAAPMNASGMLELLGIDAEGTAVRVVPRGTRNYGWQTLQPRAKQTKGDGRVNSFALGGVMELRAGLLVQTVPINGGAVHFGLGDNPGADAVRILWPNGTNQAEFDLKPDRQVVAEQRLKGSCPMLFAWDGTKMTFVTDLIWRSPLGLRINAQSTAAAMQTRDWVKVRGDQLVARGGFYDLRMTAELWETHFFDHLSLMTVDHSKGTQVFVDERFAVPQPPLKLYATGEPHPFARATDDRGNDVSDVVAVRDGRYLDGFARGQYQGVTADHWVELELPADAPADRPLVLLGFGWVHPTDSSINLALSQGRHDAPAGITIEVPDQAGGWKTARTGVGFPAGKNKTIVLDLDGLWPAGAPRKLRLRTNLEVYWDWLAWADRRDDAAIRTRVLPAAEARLAYHGFSRISAADDHSPELPDYQTVVGTEPRWLDLAGFYTRFGDVRELLEKVDDRYVIMNAGDEIRLRFPAEADVPAGQVRDFVVIADGWEKDGDYNTAFSRTVLPLPRHDWPEYDRTYERLEDDPAYRRHPDDWVNYHTRYVDPNDYRAALRAKD